MTHSTEINARNADWLANRPMWKIDKLKPELLKHPTRWLVGGGPGPKWHDGWLTRDDLNAFRRAEEIKNSKAKRK
jgi:hypothetical protein